MAIMCKPGEHEYQFVKCANGEEVYECRHCGDEHRQYADLCSGG